MAPSTPSDDVRLGQGHTGSIDLRVTDHVAMVTLRRGENRFNNDSLRKINAVLDRVESDPAVHALVLTGEGKFFSTGLDLPWIKYLADSGRNEELTAFFKGFRDLVARMLIFPMPTVAVLNGHAAAGGALLSLAFDVRVMRKDRGYFYINEVRIGLPIQGMLKELVSAKIPNGQAFTESVVFGKRLTGYDTHRLGITSAICEEQELLQTGHKTAKQILADGPYDRKTMKEHKENVFASVTVEKKLAKEVPFANFAKAITKAKM